MKLTIKRLEKDYRCKLMPIKVSKLVRAENYFYFDGCQGRCKCKYLGVNECYPLGETHLFQINSEGNNQEIKNDQFILNSKQVNKMIYRIMY